MKERKKKEKDTSRTVETILVLMPTIFNIYREVDIVRENLKKVFMIISILTFILASLVFPSLIPHKTAAASDSSLIIVIIDYTPVVVHISGGSAHMSFDGMSFDGSATNINDDNILFDLYSTTDDGYTANVEFLYSPTKILSPFRYTQYHLEDGVYKPVKQLQYRYEDIAQAKEHILRTRNTTESTSLINWQDIFPDVYFLWNKENAYSPYGTAENDTYGPIKSSSHATPTGYIENITETYRCGEDLYTKSRTIAVNRYIFPVKIYPMSTPVDSSRTAGFVMYTRGDIFRDTAGYLLSGECRETFRGTSPRITGTIYSVNLKYFRSKYINGQVYDKYRIHLVDDTDFIESFNPSTKEGGMVISSAVGILASVIAPVAPEVSTGIGILASTVGAVETYYNKPSVSIYKDNGILHVNAQGNIFHPFGIPIPLIYPDNSLNTHWHDVSYPIPGLSTSNNTFTKRIPFVPFYISFADDNPREVIEKSILNTEGTVWIAISVDYEKPRADRKHIHDSFLFKFPIYISLRYRLVR